MIEKVYLLIVDYLNALLTSSSISQGWISKRKALGTRKI